MMTHFKLEPPHFRPSRMEVNLNREPLAWDERLSGHVTLSSGPDGLCAARIRIAPTPSQRPFLKVGDLPGPQGAAWGDVRLQPRTTRKLPFDLIIPAECASNATAALIVEVMYERTTQSAEFGASIAYETVPYRVDFRLRPPRAFVRTAELIAQRTGLVVGSILPYGGGSPPSSVRVLLRAPTGGHEHLQAIELVLTSDTARVQGKAHIHPRRTAWERAFHFLAGYQCAQIEFDLPIEGLEPSISAIDFDPFLRPGRTLPVPAAKPPDVDPTQLPTPAGAAATPDSALPRPVSTWGSNTDDAAG